MRLEELHRGLGWGPRLRLGLNFTSWWEIFSASRAL